MLVFVCLVGCVLVWFVLVCFVFVMVGQVDLTSGVMGSNLNGSAMGHFFSFFPALPSEREA